MAPRKTSDDPKSSKTAPSAETKQSDTDEAAAKAAAEAKAQEDAEAKAKAEADAKAKAEEKAKAEAEAAAKALADEKVVEVGPDQKPFELLCHVRMDGETLEPGDVVTLTAQEFKDLKRLQAVEGDFDD